MQPLLPKYFEVTLLHPHPKGCAASILLLGCPVLIVVLPQSSLVTANKLCKSRARWNSALPGPLEVFKSLKQSFIYWDSFLHMLNTCSHPLLPYFGLN